jgi:predicted small metal-binding protein
MKLQDIKMAPGQWLVGNCGDMPSEKNCQLVMMGPENQRQDLLDAAVEHAVNTHGHERSDKLRQELDGMLKTVTIEAARAKA